MRVLSETAPKPLTCAAAQADVPVPQVAGTSKKAYPSSSFGGSNILASPEPAEWAAIVMLLAMAAWTRRRANATADRGR